MKREAVEALLPLLNSKKTGTRNHWVLGPCVFAPWRHDGKDAHPSFAIRASDCNKSICKCLSCGYGGDLTDLLLDLGIALKKSPAPGYNLAAAAQLIAHEFDEIEFDGASIPEFGQFKPDAEDVVFPEGWLKTFRRACVFPEAMTYLQSRGLPLKMVKALDVRFDPIRRRVGFPFRNWHGALVGLQGRALDKSNDLRYLQYRYQETFNALPWMGEDTVDLDLPVVLVEGPFDLASVWRVYQNVLASFSSGMSVAKVKRIADASEVITFYDHGKGGNAARSRIKSVLRTTHIINITPLASEGDAGAMTEDVVLKYLKPYVKTKLFG